MRIAGILWLVVACAPERDSAVRDAPLLKGLDHVFAFSQNPEPLYRVFRDSLQWPEVYAFQDYGEFASGVVSLGNVLFEVVTWKIPAGETLPTELKGLAFAPAGELPAYLATLRERGVPFETDSITFTTDSGTKVLAYVNTGLDGKDGLPPASASIFINDNLKHADAPARRKSRAEELERRNGGPLGVLSVRAGDSGAGPGARARALAQTAEFPAAGIRRYHHLAGGARDAFRARHGGHPGDGVEGALAGPGQRVSLGQGHAGFVGERCGDCACRCRGAPDQADGVNAIHWSLFEGDHALDDVLHAPFDVAPDGTFLLVRQVREVRTVVIRDFRSEMRNQLAKQGGK